MIKHFERNTVGRDFAVGDIHGCFRVLEQALKDIGFDETRDRLFSVGDLVDRGPDSDWAVDWIAKPWFHAVRGNHEQMAIGVAAGKHDQDNYEINGGGWFLRMTQARRQLFADAFSMLPVAISVDTAKGKVGVVHADMPFPTWAHLVEELTAETSKRRLRSVMENLQWSRDRILAEDRSVVSDLYALVVGHTPVGEPMRLGNVCYIDTGCVFKNGHLTIVALDELI